MAEYSKVYKKIWKNKKFKDLKDEQKFLFLYLLSCPHANILGFYYLPKKYISSDLSWSPSKIAQHLKILSKGLIKYDEENKVILILSWLEHNPLVSDNHVKKAQAELSEVPDTPLHQEFVKIIKEMPEGLHKKIINNAVQTASERRSNSEEEEEKETEKENRDVFMQIFEDTLNRINLRWKKPFAGLSEYANDLRERLDIATTGVVTKQEFQKLCNDFFDQILIEKELFAR